jgi:hypothetical protein
MTYCKLKTHNITISLKPEVPTGNSMCYNSSRKNMKTALEWLSKSVSFEKRNQKILSLKLFFRTPEFNKEAFWLINQYFRVVFELITTHYKSNSDLKNLCKNLPRDIIKLQC